MKSINDYIIEKFKISSKNAKQKYLDPEDIEGPETPGEDYFGEEVTIIGWPFKDKNDKNYKRTKEYIRKEGYSVYNDLEEIEDQDMWDYFCYACHKDEFEVDCYVYGSEGAIALNK